ncbi:MAG: Uma2 family endonuclease [Acidimicrobiales bacterium]
MSEAIAVLSFDDFCESEGESDRRHELVGGRVYAMAGGTERHDLAAGLFYEALAAGARRAGCRPFTANRLVRTPTGAGYYPDVMVVCGPAAHRLYEQEPVLVAEVLSPSTADTDRREKATAFTSSPTLGQYILIDPDRRRIEVAVVEAGALAWQAYGPGDVVNTAFAAVDIDAFYDSLEASATTAP